MTSAGLNVTPLSDWGIPFADKLIVSGPCSAENEHQVIHTALGLAKHKVNLFRSGIWKPRTRPASFQGVGVEGLKWLTKAKELTTLPMAVEVANPSHVKASLSHGIDVLWVGARTTTNPFAVQAIADALEGLDTPVMVKNPISPDLELWIGAMERLNRAGISKIAAVHRGFSSFVSDEYRNQPNWVIPIELRRRYPSIPLICDPSHICGNRKMISFVSQKAFDLLFDGLMIESHIEPHTALSDANQQLAPEDIGVSLKTLKYKTEGVDDSQFQRQMINLRQKIDDIDLRIIEMIARRMNIAKEIGEHKKQMNISILQPDRWKQIVSSRTAMGKAMNLDEGFVFRIYQYIHEEAIRQQNEATGNCGADLGTRFPYQVKD